MPGWLQHGAHAFVAIGKCGRNGQFAAAPHVRTLARRRLYGSLGALFRSFFLFLDCRAATAQSFGAGGGLFLFLETTARFLFGMTAGGLFGRFAGVLLSFAFLGGGAFFCEPRLFDNPVFGVFFGPLARFYFFDARV